MSNNEEKIILRENVIGYIYGYELFGKKLDSVEAFETGEYSEKEIKFIEAISKNYEIFKKLILSFTKDNWSWERMAPLTRATLIYGAFEISYTDKALVIDVLVRYAKNFSPDDSYKFINSVLEKIGKYYEAMKASKK